MGAPVWARWLQILRRIGILEPSTVSFKFQRQCVPSGFHALLSSTRSMTQNRYAHKGHRWNIDRYRCGRKKLYYFFPPREQHKNAFSIGHSGNIRHSSSNIWVWLFFLENCVTFSLPPVPTLMHLKTKQKIYDPIMHIKETAYDTTPMPSKMFKSFVARLYF